MACNRLMRILVVPPLDGADECLVSGCVEALEAQGHTVHCMQLTSFRSGANAVTLLPVSLNRKQQLEELAVDLISQSVVAVAEQMQAEMVLAFPRSPVNRGARNAFSELNILSCLWMTEDFAEFPYWRLAIEGYDIVATIQHEPFISEVSLQEHTAVYLPFAANGACCIPVCTHTAADGLIVVLGDASPDLCEALAPFVDRGMIIWGEGWDKEELFASGYQGKLSSLTRSQRKALYSDAAIIVNLHSTDIGNGDYINRETFAIAVCGGFQLVDRRTLMEGMFGYDELVMFESTKELAELLNEFIDDSAGRREYARNAQRTVLAKHTYLHRMEKLVEAVEEKRSSEAAVTSQSPCIALPENTPEELAGIVEALKSGHGLSGTATLEQLIDCLECQNDQSPEGAALLFWAASHR